MPTPNPEEHARIVTAGIDIAKRKLSDMLAPPPMTDVQIMQARFRAIATKVQGQVKQISDVLIAEGRSIDKADLTETAAKLFLDEMGKKFTYDELCWICAIVHAGIFVDMIV